MEGRMILGRWEDVLVQVGDCTVDLVATDPPYGSSPQPWDKRPDWGRFMAGMARVSRPTGQLWVFVRMPWAMDVYSAAIANGWRWCQEIIWEKQNAGGCTVGTFRKVHENLWHFKRPGAVTFNLGAIRVPKTTKGDKSVKGRGGSPTQFMGTGNSGYVDDGMRLPRSVIRCRNVHRTAESMGHPTQKPLALMRVVVEYSSNPGDVVLDPFAGSGTTLMAARMAGRGGWAWRQTGHGMTGPWGD